MQQDQAETLSRLDSAFSAMIKAEKRLVFQTSAEPHGVDQIDAWKPVSVDKYTRSKLCARLPIERTTGQAMQGLFLVCDAYPSMPNADLVIELECRPSNSPQTYILGRVVWRSETRKHQNRFGPEKLLNIQFTSYYGRWDHNRKFLNPNEIRQRLLPIMIPLGRKETYNDVLTFSANLFNISNLVDLPRPWNPLLVLTP